MASPTHPPNCIATPERLFGGQDPQGPDPQGKDPQDQNLRIANRRASVAFWLLMIMLLVAAIIAIALGDTGTLAGLSGGLVASIVASAAILVFLAGGLREYAGRLGTAFRDVAIWLGIGLVLILGYSFRDDLRPLYQRVAGELSPAGTGINLSSGQNGERAVRIRKRSDGHFVVRSEVNGRPVTMLVDTGASTVVLTVRDAESAGINVGQLSFSIPVSTANGTGFAASARVNSLSIGGITRGNLKVLVAKSGALRESLLGMNFLRQLRSYEFSGDFLTLRG
ncbi:MAG: TIGR02281 family clan AA aspartic protease [Pseudomonadota bacterium]